MSRLVRAVVLALAPLPFSPCPIAPSVALAAMDPAQQYGPHPPLPPIQQYLLPPMKVATVIGWGDQKPTVPDNLAIDALARDLHNPRVVYGLSNGDVLIVEGGGPSPPINRPKEIVMGWLERKSHSHEQPGQRVLLVPAGSAGKPPVVLIDHLNSPFGIVLVGGDLYVAETDRIMRYPYTPGQTRITDPGTKITDLPAGRINHHWTKSLTASPDGTKLYVGIGSNSNVGENGLDEERERAAIWEVDRATGAHRLYGTGLRNPNGLTFEPHTRQLWAVVNERDELGPDLVPDYMTSVQDGGFYGWPYSFWGQHLDPRVNPQRPDLVAHAIEPDYALSSHVAPLGMAFSYDSALPPEYRSGAFVGEHGSWDRSPPNGYKVIYVPFRDGKPDGKPRDVVTGFLVAHDQARGRPVGLALDAHGALLIADDVSGVVWRVTAKPAAGTPPS